ncbi:pyridoxal-phosphate dependent enzyme [Rhodobium gokarnense]|uniref:Threonine synthase n=1 Tax=Rhodobium gokarnense TaxID=364296 RepID=A0ABT3HCA4_9HYPH|nr:pyridoxal-phosphate dependent enzyme [Rhodobium gokarnense]MCW2307979.1 threonine synthase [Rhodobium gokarnense]
MTTETDFLRCTACGRDTDIAEVPSLCPSCGEILDLNIAPREPEPDVTEAVGLWRWANHLPHCRPENRISLGEGQSPLLAAPRLAADLGLKDLWIKNDSIMPTASFKDRAVALATSLALNYGRPGLVLSSSGNAGASGAAYAARAGLPLVVFVPASAPEAKLRQIAAAGARLVTIDGKTSDCCRLADELARTRGWVNLTTSYHNPYGVDAYATLAYETARLDPDVVLLPVSSGPVLGGIMKGYERLKASGAITRIPRPIAVQSAACAPIVRAFETGGAIEPWDHQTTIASALNDTLEGYEHDGDYTLAWIRRHNGAASAIDDDTVRTGVRKLARTEGILVEPSAAVPVAAIPSLIDRGLISRDERVLAIATGHGLKDLSWVDVEADRRGLPPGTDICAFLAS